MYIGGNTGSGGSVVECASDKREVAGSSPARSNKRYLPLITFMLFYSVGVLSLGAPVFDTLGLGVKILPCDRLAGAWVLMGPIAGPTLVQGHRHRTALAPR